MPKMKFYDDATSQWVELDAKNADTVGGKTPEQLLENAKVKSVNGKEGEVLLTAGDIPLVESQPDFTILTSLNIFEGEFSKKADKNTLSTVATSGNYNDLTNKPTASDIDVVNLDSTVEDLIEFHDEQIKKKVDKTGDTMTGILTAQSNTSYTTRQVRNMILSTGDAVNSQMQNGDIWIKYK